MRHWRRKEFYFFWQSSMRNASEAKERFPKLKQNFSTVLLKKSAVFQQGVLDKMGVLMLWRKSVQWYTLPDICKTVIDFSPSIPIVSGHYGFLKMVSHLCNKLKQFPT